MIMLSRAYGDMIDYDFRLTARAAALTEAFTAAAPAAITYASGVPLYTHTGSTFH